MRVRKSDPEFAPNAAEGLCEGLPYDTELAGPDGVYVHFWVSPELEAKGAEEVKQALDRALTQIRRQRDVVEARYSVGTPDRYWNHANYGVNPTDKG